MNNDKVIVIGYAIQQKSQHRCFADISPSKRRRYWAHHGAGIGQGRGSPGHDRGAASTW